MSSTVLVDRAEVLSPEREQLVFSFVFLEKHYCSLRLYTANRGPQKVGEAPEPLGDGVAPWIEPGRDLGDVIGETLDQSFPVVWGVRILGEGMTCD